MPIGCNVSHVCVHSVYLWEQFGESFKDVAAVKSTVKVDIELSGEVRHVTELMRKATTSLHHNQYAYLEYLINHFSQETIVALHVHASTVKVLIIVSALLILSTISSWKSPIFALNVKILQKISANQCSKLFFHSIYKCQTWLWMSMCLNTKVTTLSAMLS